MHSCYTAGDFCFETIGLVDILLDNLGKLGKWRSAVFS